MTTTVESAKPLLEDHSVPDEDVKQLAQLLTAKLDELSKANASNSDLPTVMGAPIRPWINFVHTVGLPWAMLFGLCYWGVPYAKALLTVLGDMKTSQDSTTTSLNESKERLDKLDGHATKAMPLLEEATKAVPILQEIQRTTRDGVNQRKNDISNLRSDLNLERTQKDNGQ